MAVSDPWRRYLEAGMEFTEVTRSRAEKLVKQMVKTGDVQFEESQQWVEDLLDRSRKSTEAFAQVVRDEVVKQMQNLGLVEAPKPAAPKPTAAKTPKKTAAKKTAAKKAQPAKKPAPKKAVAKKVAAKKAPAGKKAAGTS